MQDEKLDEGAQVEFDSERRPWIVCGTKRRRLHRRVSGGCDDWEVQQRDDGSCTVASAAGLGPSYALETMFQETQPCGIADSEWMCQMIQPEQRPLPSALCGEQPAVLSGEEAAAHVKESSVVVNIDDVARDVVDVDNAEQLT